MKNNLLFPVALAATALTIGLSTFSRANAASTAQELEESVAIESPAGNGYDTYGIAFYNLENLFDTINSNGTYDHEFSPRGAREWNSEKYWAKINKMAYAISQMTDDRTPDGPAIIGIAEVENARVVKDLVNAEPLADKKLKFVHHDSPDLRGIDVALLYNPEMFRVLNVTNTPLTEINFATRDQMAVTGILGGTDTVSVIVCHWPSRLGKDSSPSREAAGRLARHIADSLWTVNPNQHVIVMGDLNDDPNNNSVHTKLGLGAGFNASKTDKHNFYNPWQEIWEPEYRGTLSYKGAWNLFDQIIISGTLLDNKKGKGTGELVYDYAQINDFDFLKNPAGTPYAGTPHRTYAGGKWLDGYSDHFPTEIFLKVRK